MVISKRLFSITIVILLLPHMLSCTDQTTAKNLATISLTSPAPMFNRNKNVAIESIAVSSLNVFPANFTLSRLGEVVQLNIHAQLTNGEIFNNTDSVQWASSDESVIRVDQHGLVISQGFGSATLSAELDGFRQSFSVRVDASGRTINGLVRYEDRNYDRDGLILFPPSPNYKAVRFTTIELLDVDDNVIKSLETSEQGQFSFGNILLDKYRIRVLAQVENDIAAGFTVYDMNKNIYAVSREGDSTANTHDLQISAESGVGGAFNILDVMTVAADFSRQALTTSVQDLEIYWEEGNQNGTFYCTELNSLCVNGPGIYVYSQHRFVVGASSVDYDEYDDDVLLHEYGHYLVEQFAQDDSPGGCHNLTDNDLDLRLAWSEGLGTFFSIAIKDWLKNTNPALLSSTEPVTLYVDTQMNRSNQSEAYINFDVANFTDADPLISAGRAEEYFFASSEVAVLKILWQLTQEIEVQQIWHVVSNYFSQAEYPANLATFWDGLLAQQTFSAIELQRLRAMFNERRVFYQDDSYEVDDFAGATLVDVNGLPPTEHTLYKQFAAPDVDVFAFDADAGIHYLIQTLNLRNGIDTFIRLLDDQGMPLIIDGVTQENDDAAPGSYLRIDPACSSTKPRVFVDKTSLASELTFSPSSSARYYVEVTQHKKFKREADFTGHYGSYQLSISTHD